MTRSRPYLRFMMWVVFVWLTLVACSSNQVSAATPTPNFTIPPLIPRRLDCGAVPSVQEVEGGPSWNGLTIGQSTRSEVEAVLSPAQAEDNSWGYTEFKIPEGEEEIDAEEWFILVACFDGNILSMLNIYPGEDSAYYFRPMDEWIDEKGSPDHVTWGDEATSRSLIWPEDGLLVVASDSGNRDTGIRTPNFLLFPPIARDELETSWLMSALPDEQWPIPPDVAYFSPNLATLEDPWEVEKQ